MGFGFGVFVFCYAVADMSLRFLIFVAVGGFCRVLGFMLGGLFGYGLLIGAYLVSLDAWFGIRFTWCAD